MASLSTPVSRAWPTSAIWFSALAWLATAFPLLAHDPGLSVFTVQLQREALDAEVILSVKDASLLVSLDPNADGQTTPAELAAAEAALASMAAEGLEIAIDGQLVPIAGATCRFHQSDNAAVRFTLPGRPAATLRVRSSWLALLPSGHRQFLTVQSENGKSLAERLLSAESDSTTIELESWDVPVTQRTSTSSFLDFLGLGFKHILIGYDHLLFLFSLLIVSRHFFETLKVITAFTVAHSITLALATLNIVQMPGRIVEPLIAASIIYVAIENLVRRDAPKGRTLLVFGFGLIHGLGFASVLRELGVGTTATGIAVPLLSFNLGVELGQVLVSTIFLPFIWLASERPSFTRGWIPACSVLTALAGGYWLVQRVLFSS